MGQIFGGRFELVDPIAQGAIGSVWRVWDRRDQTYRAGKVLRQADSASLVRFVRETGWRIDHPHVVAPLNWCGEDDRVIFTMPLVRGGSLQTVLQDNGPLPVWWVAAVADQLLDALAAVHAQRLVHRDVKPANVLLEPTGIGRPEVRLGDFGIATSLDDPRLTSASQVIGTPGYLSPEALAGAAPDPRQDLYAVGILVVQMLTGRRPTPPDIVPPAALRTPLGQWVARLVGPVEGRGTAASAREALLALQLPTHPATTDEQVEVFDQVPALPSGWGPNGPVGGASAAPGPAGVGTADPDTGPRATVLGEAAGQPTLAATVVDPGSAATRRAERPATASPEVARVPGGSSPEVRQQPTSSGLVSRFGSLALSLVGVGLVLLAAALFLL